MSTNMSDEPNAGQVPPAPQDGSTLVGETEFERIINQRVREQCLAQGILWKIFYYSAAKIA